MTVRMGEENTFPERVEIEVAWVETNLEEVVSALREVVSAGTCCAFAGLAPVKKSRAAIVRKKTRGVM